MHRGNCSFTTKANIAETANASAVLIINYRTGIWMLLCSINHHNFLKSPNTLLYISEYLHLSLKIKRPTCVLFFMFPLKLLLFLIGCVFCMLWERATRFSSCSVWLNHN